MLTLTKETDNNATRLIGRVQQVPPTREESALIFSARAFMQSGAVFEAALVAPMKVLVTEDDQHTPYAFTNAMRHMWLVRSMLEWIDAKRLAFIIAHEALHAALGDAVRLNSPEVVRPIASIATDLRINGILMQRIQQRASNLTDTGFKFIDMQGALDMLSSTQPHTPAKQPDKANPSLPITGFGDPSLCEESVESIYVRLLAALPPEKQQQVSRMGAQDVHPQAKAAPDEGDSESDKDGGQNESDDPGSATAQREMAARLAAAAIAEQTHQRSRGRAVDDFTSRFVGDNLKAEVDWRAKLLRLIGKPLARDDYSMRRPNRRALLRGVITASLRSEEVKRLAVVCDTSGSVSNVELQKQAAEVASIVGRARVKEVQVAFVDPSVRATQVFKRGQKITFKPAGGGGTDFCPGIEWAEDLKPDAIIYFTDGYGRFPDRAPRVPMIWVAVGRHTISDGDFPFGDVVRVGR